MRITDKGIADFADRVFNQPFYIGLFDTLGVEPNDNNYDQYMIDRSGWKIQIKSKMYSASTGWFKWKFDNFRGEIAGFFLKNENGDTVCTEDFDQPFKIRGKGDSVRVRAKITDNFGSE